MANQASGKILKKMLCHAKIDGFLINVWMLEGAIKRWRNLVIMQVGSMQGAHF